MIELLAALSASAAAGIRIGLPLLIIGLFTRQAVIPLIITMLVAIFVIHGDDPFKDKEMAILYLIPYIRERLVTLVWLCWEVSLEHKIRRTERIKLLIVARIVGLCLR